MQQNYSLTIKEVSEQGAFVGYATTPAVDRGGDVILPGSLSWSGVVPMLYGHGSPIGIYRSLVWDESGLRVEGEINMDVQLGREAYSLLKQGAIQGLSVGILVSEREYKDNIRIITKGELLEISLTPVPMNPAAQVTQVKQVEAEALPQAQPEAQDQENHFGTLLTYMMAARLRLKINTQRG